MVEYLPEGIRVMAFKREQLYFRSRRDGQAFCPHETAGIFDRIYSEALSEGIFSDTGIFLGGEPAILSAPGGSNGYKFPETRRRYTRAIVG